MSQSPLAERLRPRQLDDVVGQQALLAPDGFLRRVIEAGKPLSLLFWGPPGCGKTTLARLYAEAFDARFVALSAVFSGVADLKKLVKELQETPLFSGQTVVFVDEIHRFNKAQQDAFLPYVEQGLFTLVGATTENPSFSLNAALLSRLRVVTLEALGEADLLRLLERCEKALGPLPLTDSARSALAAMAQGDGRYLCNLVEHLVTLGLNEVLDPETLAEKLQRRAPLMDRAGESHYNLISALHKSVRGSDPDAALYWLARMLAGGEDPLFLARRLIRMATEDIGLADPHALQQAIAARDAYEMLGSPEGELALAQATLYLALAPKSNATYTAYKQAIKSAHESSQHPPPKIILNAPTKLMKDLGYGDGYVYDHDTPEGCSGQDYFPDEMERPSFYRPAERGVEREMRKRMDYFASLRATQAHPSSPHA